MSIKSHFDDCPFYCDENGKLLDTNTGNIVECPHCSKLKKEMLAKGMAIEEETSQEVPLADLLGIKSKYLTEKYVFDNVIPADECLFLEQESIDCLRDISTQLYKDLSIGELPKSSYCFGISIKGNFERIAYPMLAIAYLGGLKVGKLVTCMRYARLLISSSDELDEYLDADIVFMVLTEGSTKADISSAKGLMQTRASEGKPTIFITTWTIEACSLLLGYLKDEDCLSLAKPVFVKYKNSGKQSHYINQLTGVENSRYEEPQGYSLSDL